MAYIERETTIKELEKMPAYFESGDIRYGIIIAIDILEKQTPAADVVEVKHGENITKMYPTDEFICSECGLIMRDFEEILVDEENDECHYEFEFKYCPQCGAKMDGKDGE